MSGADNHHGDETTRLSLETVSRCLDAKKGVYVEEVQETLADVHIDGMVWMRAAHGGSVEWKNRVLSQLANVRFSFDNAGWFWLHLPEFELKQAASVRFEFRDASSTWKGGMEWDLVQLNRVITASKKESEMEMVPLDLSCPS